MENGAIGIAEMQIRPGQPMMRYGAARVGSAGGLKVGQSLFEVRPVFVEVARSAKELATKQKAPAVRGWYAHRLAIVPEGLFHLCQRRPGVAPSKVGRGTC